MAQSSRPKLPETHTVFLIDKMLKYVKSRKLNLKTHSLPDPIRILNADCVGYAAPEAIKIKTRALLEGCIKAGYETVYFLKVKDNDPQLLAEYLKVNRPILEELKTLGVQIVNSIEYCATEEFERGKKACEKLLEFQKDHLAKDIAKARNDHDFLASAEDKDIETHIKHETSFVLGWAEKPLTIILHDKFFNLMHLTAQISKRLGLEENAIALVVAKKYFDEGPVKKLEQKPQRNRESKREFVSNSDVPVPFDALTTLVGLGKKGIPADWAANVINATHLEFDALTAMVTLGRQGVDPAWTAVVLCGILFGKITPSRELQVLVERQQDVNKEATGIVKVTLAKDAKAMHSMSGQFNEVNLDSLSSDPDTRDALSRELANTMRSEVRKRIDPISTEDACIGLGLENVSADWSAAFLKVYGALMRLHLAHARKPACPGIPSEDLKEVRLETTQDGVRAKLTLASSQQAIAALNGPFERVEPVSQQGPAPGESSVPMNAPVFTGKSSIHAPGTMFSIVGASTPTSTLNSSTELLAEGDKKAAQVIAKA